MKPFYLAAVFTLLQLSSTPIAHAQHALPADGDREQWQELLSSFAECSAVYNLAAPLKSKAAAQGSQRYRELANQALVSGIYSADKLQLGESYLQTIYTVKLEQWQGFAKQTEKHQELLAKASACIQTIQADQDAILAILRTTTARQ